MRALHILHPFRLTAGFVIGVVALWLIGFAVFFADVVFAGPQHKDQSADVIVVLTGGPGRVEEGFALMAEQKGKSMLVTGVHPDVTLQALISRWDGPAADKAKLSQGCCIAIEHKAESTEDNAAETRAWLDSHGGASNVSVRLVTSDYHMPRAKLLFSRAMPDATLEAWPVKSTNTTAPAFWRTVLIEYSKTLLTWLS